MCDFVPTADIARVGLVALNLYTELSGEAGEPAAYQSLFGWIEHETLALLWQFFHFHRCHLRFAFPIRNSYPTDIPRKVPLNCQSSASDDGSDTRTAR